MLAPYSSAGRLTKANKVKYKILELLPLATNPVGSWGLGFGNYNQAVFDAKVAFAKSLGANAVKINGGGPTPNSVDTWPALPKYEAIMQSYCKTLRKYGMKLYLQMANGPLDLTGPGGGNTATQVAAFLVNYAMWVKHGSDLIIGVDACNESNLARPTTWPTGNSTAATNQTMQHDLGMMLAGLRSVAPYIPVSFSVYIGLPLASSYAQASLRLQATLGCDYHDYHAYNGVAAIDYSVAPTSAPKGADMAILEAQSWFLGRYINTESGIPGSNGQDTQEAWVRGLKEQAMRSASHGSVYFGDIDFNLLGAPGPVGDYGLTGHPVLVGAFSGWPARPTMSATG